MWDNFDFAISQDIKNEKDAKVLDSRKAILGILQNLSVNQENKILLASDDFSFITSLMTIIATEKGETRSNAL